MIARRPSATRLTIGGPMKNTVLGIINNHLSTSEKDKVKIQKVAKKPRAPVMAVNKSGSRIQVVSRRESPPRRSLKSSSARRREGYGTMRSDEVSKDTRRKPAFARTDLKNLKFQVKTDETELIGIDLKSVSLKRQIKNDAQTEVGKYGTLQRTVGNKKDRDRDRKREESDSDEEPKRKIKERKSRTLYKNALNDVLENKKKAKSAAESRKRASRKELKDMQESSESEEEPSPVKRKKKSSKSPAKKTEKSESEASDEEPEVQVMRRPGERGKSAAKEKFEENGEVYSPIEGYRLKVSNLNTSVSESDLVDLFCAIGAIRDARLTSTPGSAVITFVKRAAAMAAITKYNGRELDKQKISVDSHRVMDLPSKHPYQWRNEYPTKKPRVRQELVGDIHASILLPSLAGVTLPGAKPVVFTVKV